MTHGKDEKGSKRKAARAIEAFVVVWNVAVVAVIVGFYVRDVRAEGALVDACMAAHAAAARCHGPRDEARDRERCDELVEIRRREEMPICCLRSATEIFRCNEGVYRDDCEPSALESCAEEHRRVHAHCDDSGWYDP